MFHQGIIDAVDACKELNGAGIVLIDSVGTSTEIRGGPRIKWVYISLELAVVQTTTPEKKVPTFWDRWGNSVLS